MIPKQINIGPFAFHLYGFIIGTAIVAGWYLSKKRSRIYNIPEKIFEDYLLVMPIIASLIGARVYHVIDYWNVYQQNVVSILYIQNGGLGIWGAIIGGIIGTFIYCKIRKLNFPTMLDLFSPSLILGQAFGRIGNFINQEGFGPPTSVSWKVYIEPASRPLNYISNKFFHPTFFYEAILNLMSFFILIAFANKLKKPGQIFAIYLILYSLSRFITEHFRIDTWVIGSLKVSYLFSTICLTLGVLIYIFSSKHKRLDKR
jgi:phosphatidylglycerol:prolipoprotein diacylglycerol transferase